MNDQRYSAGHRTALRRFATVITVVTLLGHTVLGFEASYAQPLLALATGYSVQFLLEFLEAWSQGRKPRFIGGRGAWVDFFLSTHITSLAVPMLLFFNDRLWVVAFTVAVAIGSKTLFRAPFGGGTRHIFNPSNFGIIVTLLLFPSVGIAMPWQFTADISGAFDWILPGIIWVSGGYLNLRLTKKGPMIAAWLGGFVLQASLRSLLFSTSLVASLTPMTGVTFALLTLYMIPDPATTPQRPWRQAAFGGAVAALYGLFMAVHIVYGVFAALTIVCAVRGCALYVEALVSRRRPVHGWRRPAGVGAEIPPVEVAPR
jgi:hypothetical protein